MSQEYTPGPVPIRQMLGKFWTVANALSLVRMLLVVPVVYLIATDGPTSVVLGLVTLAVATDWIDGRLARWSNTVSDWGKVLDPLADKFAAIMVTGALFFFGPLRPYPWFLALILVRDLLIVAGGVRLGRRYGHVVMSLWFGKAAVVLLSITVLAALLDADPPVLAVCVWATTALLMLSFVQYLFRYRRLARSGRNAPAGAEAPSAVETAP